MKFYLLPLLLGVNIAYSAEKSDKFSLRENEGTNLQSQAQLNTLSPRVNTSRPRESDEERQRKYGRYWNDLYVTVRNQNMFPNIYNFTSEQLNNPKSGEYPLEFFQRVLNLDVFIILLERGADPSLCRNLERRIRENINGMEQERENVLNPNEDLFYSFLIHNFELHGVVMRTYSQEERNIVFSARNIQDITNSNLSDEKKYAVIRAINVRTQNHANYVNERIAKHQQMLDALHSYQPR